MKSLKSKMSYLFITLFVISMSSFRAVAGNPILGKWKVKEVKMANANEKSMFEDLQKDDGVFEFLEGGIIFYGHHQYEGNYTIEGNKIILTNNNTPDVEVTFSIEKSKLTLFFKKGNSIDVVHFVKQ